MFWEQPVQFASQCDVGLRRDNNEDACVVRLARKEEAFREHGHLFVVADGMGGHAVGELASKLAIETVPLVFLKTHGTGRAEALRRSVEEANRVIFERGSANADFRRMGTTCSALLLSPDGVIVAHVGDSRVYRVRDHRIDQLTFDHSLQWELRRQGRIRPEEEHLLEPRNVITRSLGPEAEVDVDVEGPFPIVGGDAYVLCSDGLIAHVKDAEIGAVVRSLPPKEACRLLVNLALARGGTDNVTVVVLQVGRASSVSVAETSTRLHPVARERRTRYGYLAAGLLFVVGVLLAAIAKVWTAGSVVAVLGVATAVASHLWATRRREEERHRIGDVVGGGDTVVWRPHATDTAQLTKRFLEELRALDEELVRVAREEEWEIDWKRHDAALGEATQALESKPYSRALSSLAAAFDAVVAGIVAQRNRVVREARWGRAASE